VRYRADGNVEFLGRSDDQIKIRGFRIELGEIESVLLQHPAVQQAVALAQKDERGEKRLLAYLRGRARADSLCRGAARTPAGAVPDYMLPAAIIALPKIPLTANGKLDRNALPHPSRSSLPPGGTQYRHRGSRGRDLERAAAPCKHLHHR